MYASVAESMNDNDDDDDIPCFFTHKEMQILEALQMTLNFNAFFGFVECMFFEDVFNYVCL
jgi:hypothetical protein